MAHCSICGINEAVYRLAGKQQARCCENCKNKFKEHIELKEDAEK